MPLLRLARVRRVRLTAGPLLICSRLFDPGLELMHAPRRLLRESEAAMSYGVLPTVTGVAVEQSLREKRHRRVLIDPEVA